MMIFLYSKEKALTCLLCGLRKIYLCSFLEQVRSALSVRAGCVIRVLKVCVLFQKQMQDVVCRVEIETYQGGLVINRKIFDCNLE